MGVWWEVEEWGIVSVRIRLWKARGQEMGTGGRVSVAASERVEGGPKGRVGLGAWVNGKAACVSNGV